MSELQWWGYLHTNGSIQVKRYFDEGDLTEARESPFVVTTCRPFDADNRDEAIKIASGKLKN